MLKINKKQLTAILLAQGISLAANVLPVSATSQNTTIISASETMRSLTQQELSSYDDYYIIYLNGQLRVAVRKRIKDTDFIYQYYDAKNGEFIGQTIKVNIDQRVEEELSKYEFSITNSLQEPVKGDAHFTIKGGLNDNLYFNGEYGFGKNIPTTAVIPLTYVSQAKVLELINDSEQLISYYCKINRRYGDYQVVSSRTYDIKPNPNYSIFSMSEEEYMKLVDGIALLLPFSPGYLLAVASLEDSLIQEPFNIDIEEEKRSLSFLRYTCEKSDGTVDQLTGYRCSPYPKDKGYKYVYDVLTGIIFDTSLYKSIKSDVTDIYRFDDLMEWYKTEEFKECKKKGMVDKNGQLITEESIGIHYNEITRIDISLSYYNCVKLYYGESFKEFEDFDIQNIVYIIQQCNGLKKLFYFDWEVKDYFVHSMLQSVPNPENLIGLHIIGHRFSEEFINLEDINRFKNLEQLSLQSVNITDISELNLDNFPNLRGLDVSNNHIVDISKISSPSLKSLKLDNNELTKLSDLENLPKLTILSVDDNFISDISELKSSSVVVIDISNNKLTEFVSLENLPDLLILDVTGNYLTDTSYIKDYYIEKLKNTKFKFDFTDDGQKSQYDNPKIYQKK